MRKAILIFAKNLVHGQVKTRLAATAGNDLALTVYHNLLQHTCTITKNLPADKILFYSDTIVEQDLWDNKIYRKQVQCGHDLGDRMKNAFIYALKNGYEKVAIIGTDCFDLTPSVIMDAFDRLQDHDLAIGPAMDGGYYLLAMKKLHAEIFHGIHWSTEKVLSQTIAICKSNSLNYFLLPQLSDIDDEEDLNKVKDRLFFIKPA